MLIKHVILLLTVMAMFASAAFIFICGWVVGMNIFYCMCDACGIVAYGDMKNLFP